MHTADKEITEQDVRMLLALPAHELTSTFLSAFSQKDVGQALQVIRQLMEEGRDVTRFTQGIISSLRCVLLVKLDQHTKKILEGDYSTDEVNMFASLATGFSEPQLRGMMLTLMDSLSKMHYSPFPFLSLELSAIEIISRLNAAAKK